MGRKVRCNVSTLVCRGLSRSVFSRWVIIYSMINVAKLSVAYIF
jgi:hypothetical protein